MAKTIDRKSLLSEVRRVVVKVGSNVLTGDGDAIDPRAVAQLAKNLHALRERGCEVVLVSSGAIAAGLSVLGAGRRPAALPELQAAAAVGQSRLIAAYDRHFSRYGYHAAQILLTYEDLENRARYLNVRNTIGALLRAGIVPVINENDTVAVDEIKFGDNDLLSSFVAHMLPADLLILLTVVDGLMDGAGNVINVVEKVTDEVAGLADASKSTRGVGGMQSKLGAVKHATDAGHPCVIANGQRANILQNVLDGKSVGTLFLASASKIKSRKRWLGFVRRPKGTLFVDDGARRALVETGKSLLASGVTGLSGRFAHGDVVSIAVAGAEPFAQGMVNYDAEQIQAIKGLKTPQIRKLLGQIVYEEVVHRDNMVIIS